MTTNASSRFAYRPATASDALCVGVLGAQVWLDAFAPDGIVPTLAREVVDYFSTEAMDKEIADPAIRFILATDDERLVGFAQVDLSAKQADAPDAPALELHRLYVMQRFRGRGLGKALLEQSDTLARDLGRSSIWLTTWSGNVHALEFFRRQAFVDAGTTTYSFENQHYENAVLARTVRGAPSATLTSSCSPPGISTSMTTGEAGVLCVPSAPA